MNLCLSANMQPNRRLLYVYKLKLLSIFNDIDHNDSCMIHIIDKHIIFFLYICWQNLKFKHGFTCILVALTSRPHQGYIFTFSAISVTFWSLLVSSCDILVCRWPLREFLFRLSSRNQLVPPVSSRPERSWSDQKITEIAENVKMWSWSVCWSLLVPTGQWWSHRNKN